MIESKKDFEKITDFGNLYHAYKKSKSGKGFSKSSQKFQVAALDGIHQIKRRLETKTYEVSKYNEFTIYEPKERIIKAGSFVDKIVQHSLCDNILIPTFEKEFIQTNFAGQLGKGTLYGLDCLKTHMFLSYQKYGYDCWVVKADISKFFYNINHDILKDMVRYFVKDDDVYWLCESFINSTDGLGLPLGNQVSQVFALLYLSGLDHFITGELGVKYYGRYMDDFYLIVESKEYAKWCLTGIQEFVYSLGLGLNSKTQIIPFKNGIKFCGFHTYVTDNGRLIRKLKNENKRAAKKKFKKMVCLVEKGKLSREKFNESYSAWKNHISHGNCVKLGYEMDKYVDRLLKGEKKMKKTLIVVDMQNDFIDGSLGTKEAQSIVGNVKNKIAEYHSRGDEIIFTRDTHTTDYLNTPEGKKLPVEHCILGTHGWQIADGLEVENCKYIDKPTFGWMHWGDMVLEDVELVGLCTDICVVSNALILKAMFPDIEITVDASCCAGVTPESHSAALTTMKMCQINVIGE